VYLSDFSIAKKVNVPI